MTAFTFTSPDGKSYTVNGPDGATQEQAFAVLQTQLSHARGDSLPPELRAGYQYNSTNGMSGVDKFRAGAGKAFVDLGRGAGQLVGLESRQQVADSRQLDAPLMQSGAAKAGNIVGNVAATIPALAIPGANTVAGAGAIGAGLGLLQPSTSTRETLTNTVAGGALGAGSQWAGQKVAGALASRAANAAQSAADEASLNAVRDSVLKEAKDAGYVVPPTAINHNATNTALESISGKAATRQSATAKNVRVTNNLVRQDLGIAPNQPITQQALGAVRQKAGASYQAVKDALPTFDSDQKFMDAVQAIRDVSPDLEAAYPGVTSQANADINSLVDSISVDTHKGASAIGLSKVLRNKASANFKAAFASGGNPEKLALGQAQNKAANAIEDLIGRKLDEAGQADLAAQWKDARALIAKTYSVQGALKGNNVSALHLAAQLQKGKPLSGGVALAARFGDQFKDVAGLPKSGAGVSKLAATVLGGEVLGGIATGHPGAALGAVALTGVAPYATRAAMLSKVGQGVLAKPSYGPGLLNQFANKGGRLGALYGALPLTDQALTVQGK